MTLDHPTTRPRKTTPRPIDAPSPGQAPPPGPDQATSNQRQTPTRTNSARDQSGPLAEWSVLVPRAPDQAKELCERLRLMGATPVSVPVIAVAPPRTPEDLRRTMTALAQGRYRWVVLTSANAVRAVEDQCRELGLGARAFGATLVAAVGTATAAELRNRVGIRADLTPAPSAGQSAWGLLRSWPHYDPVIDHSDKVLFPRADIAADTLVTGLAELGWQVEAVTAYQTVPAAPPPAVIRDAVTGGAIDAIVLTSPSTVRNLLAITGTPHPDTLIACIGPTTADAARTLGLRVDATASTPSPSALVQALAVLASKPLPEASTALSNPGISTRKVRTGVTKA
jgi:uroporphyrinogen III methyltransferase/synthase